MNSRTKKFFSYYKPYLGLFISVMLCAFIVAAIYARLPVVHPLYHEKCIGGRLCRMRSTRSIMVGAFMLALVAVQTACNFFVDYRGHAMGAMMESDMRSELFDHYQKLSFRFYDEQRTGQLMSRITNDLLLTGRAVSPRPGRLPDLSGQVHRRFVILININVQLTLAVFIFLPIMAIFSLLFQQKNARWP